MSLSSTNADIGGEGYICTSDECEMSFLSNMMDSTAVALMQVCGVLRCLQKRLTKNLIGAVPHLCNVYHPL